MRFDFQGKFSVEGFRCKFNRERKVCSNSYLFS